MTFRAIADFFRDRDQLPIAVDAVLDWIRANTDHKQIDLHAVRREGRGYRGGFRRIGLPVGMYGADYEIVTQIFFGDDLPEPEKRLVIVKEALHVFDGPQAQVTTPAALRQLIPLILAPELQKALFMPAFNDEWGVYRAMALLVPAAAREKLKASVESGARTIAEVADYVRLPEFYVDVWLRYGRQIEDAILPVVDGAMPHAAE